MSAAKDFRSGEPVLAFDEALRVVGWNDALQALTGIPADEALGRFCWELIGARDETGASICHAGCSYARLARDGWPLPTHDLSIRTGAGRQAVTVSTVRMHDEGGGVIVLNLMRARTACIETNGNGNGRVEAGPALTSRQIEILGLLADGTPAKVIAGRLGIREVTVRNHIRAILRELDAHSQLEAVAKARRCGLLEP